MSTKSSETRFAGLATKVLLKAVIALAIAFALIRVIAPPLMSAPSFVAFGAGIVTIMLGLIVLLWGGVFVWRDIKSFCNRA